MGLQALWAISMTSFWDGVCKGLRTGETGGSSQPLSWSSWCEDVAVQIRASSSGSSKKPGVARGGGCPNLGLWGRRPGLGGDIIIAAARGGSKPPTGVPASFFQGPGARRAVLPRFLGALGGLAPRFERGRGVRGGGRRRSGRGGANSSGTAVTRRAATKLAVGLQRPTGYCLQRPRCSARGRGWLFRPRSRRSLSRAKITKL